MKHWPLLFILNRLLIIAIPLLISYVLIATDVGLQSIAWLAQHFVPGLQTLQVQGRLIGPLDIQTLHYQNQTISIQMQQAALDWQPSALFNGKVIIENLQANQVVVKILNASPKKDSKETNLNWLHHFYIKHVQLKNVSLEPNNLQLKLWGSLTEQWNIHWRAQLQQKTNSLHQQNSMPQNSVAEKNNFENLFNNIQGSFIANGAILGEKLMPRINIKLNANNLIIEQWQAASLQMTLNVDLTPQMNSSIIINGSQFKYKDYVFNTVSFQGQGQINSNVALNWRLQARLMPTEQYQGSISAQGNVSGNYQAPKVNANINILQGQLKAIKFAVLKTRLMADFAAHAPSKLQINLNGLRIKQYQFAPIQVQALLNRAQPSLAIQLAKGSVRYSLHEEMHTLTWQASAINFAQQAQDVAVQGRLILTPQQYLKFDLKLLRYELFMPVVPQQAIQGNVNLSVQQIAPFLREVTFLQNVQGLFHADLKITGTYAKPQLLGAINLDDAKADAPALNLQIRNIHLQAQGNPNGVVRWSGQAQSGQGILSLKGTTVINQANYPTNLTLTGDNITVSDTEQYKIIASPNLQISYANKRLTISGSIKLPQANINLGDGTNDTVELSKDVVFVGDEQKKSNYNLPLYAQIKVIAGDDINLQYEGLQTQLRGQVLINDSPDHPVTGLGEIDFHKGSYTYYGQTLTLRSGSRIIFNGAIDDPLLNIQAIKKVEVAPNAAVGTKTASDLAPTNANLSSSAVLPGQTQQITVGVSVQDNTKNPTISLFSEPAILNQTDILSYLVVGQPSDQLGAAGAGVLFNAASSLNFGGTSQFKDTLQELQKTVGIDFNIKSSAYINPATNQTQQNTSVVLGKALSPRIYISYSVGILESLNTLQIRYLLSKAWTLQSTTSSIGNGVDLLYMIERGK